MYRIKVAFIVLIFLAASLLACFSCKKDSPPEPPTTKDPRTYTWTVDTIAAPGSLQTSMRDVWGSSPRDVYVVGHNERGFGQMFHYDGYSWQMVRLVTAEGGLIPGPIDLEAILGFAANDIYAVGERLYTNSTPPPNILDSSLIIHFDGTNWREITTVRGDLLQAIGGATPNDLWAGGAFAPSLYHISNRQAVFLGNDSGLAYSDFGGPEPTDIYALAYRVAATMDSTHHYLYQYNGSSWGLQSSFIEAFGASPPLFGSYSLWADKPSGRVYSVGGGGVFLKDANGWQRVLDSGTYPLLNVFGTSQSNIFACGEGCFVYHCNGTDWKQLNELRFLTSSYFYSGIWTDGVEAFIVGHGAGKSYVLHGQ
jgi:hypothetical protein